MTYAHRLNGGSLTENGQEVEYPGVNGNGWKVAVIADGTGFGNAEPLTQTFNTLMTQGSWEGLKKFGNRAPALVIEIEGKTADGLNAGEVWLSSLMRPGTLEWLPPGHTVWTVFDVVTAHIERSYDEAWDLDETRWVRRYLIPIRALPNARSRTLTITPATPTMATPMVDVQIDGGSSVTGWSAQIRPITADLVVGDPTPVTPTVVSGAVRASATFAARGLLELRYGLSSAVPTDTPYLRVDLAYTRVDIPKLIVNGEVTVPPALIQGTSSGGVWTGSIYYRLPAGVTWVRLSGEATGGGGTSYVQVDQLRRQSRLPDIGTGRQKITALYPGGSAPAAGTLSIVSATSARLDRTIVYTYPMGRPSPNLMQHRTQSLTVTPDTDTLNGGRYALSSAIVFDVPVGQLHTNGLASVYAKLWSVAGPTVLQWTVAAMMGSTAISSDSYSTDIADTTVPGVGQRWAAVPLGLIHLPGVHLGAGGFVRITMQKASGSGTLWIDDAWTFAADADSALTIVDCGSGTAAIGGPASELWIDAPSPVAPAGRVTVSHSGRTNERSPVGYNSQVHRFPAGGVSVLTAAFGSEPITSLQHYRAWTHHAGS